MNRAVGLHVRARLDVQGVHRRRRARGQSRHARDALLPARRLHDVRSHAARLAPARRRDAHRRADPRPVEQRRRREGRARDRRETLLGVGRACSASADRPASRCPARSGASCRPTTSTPAPRSSTCRSGRASPSRAMQMMAAYAAIANGGILRTPQIVRSIGGERGARAGRQTRHLGGTAASVREMLRGVLAAGGTASEAQIEGYDLAGKTGTANKVDADTGEYSRRATSPRSSASRRRATPSCSCRSSWTSRRRDLRRRGRGAGVPEDRRVRAAVPRHRAVGRAAARGRLR